MAVSNNYMPINSLYEIGIQTFRLVQSPRVVLDFVRESRTHGCVNVALNLENLTHMPSYTSSTLRRVDQFSQFFFFLSLTSLIAQVKNLDVHPWSCLFTKYQPHLTYATLYTELEDKFPLVPLKEGGISLPFRWRTIK